MKIPERNVTPDNPNAAKIETPSLSKIADTTASSFTTKPRNAPVLAVVFEITFEPVYPAEKELAEMLIYLINVLLLVCCSYWANALRPYTSVATFDGVFQSIFTKASTL